MHRAASSALRGHRPSLASWSCNARITPSPCGEQVAAAVRDLAQLGHRGVDVERFTARVAGGRAGDSGARDPVRVGFAAGDGHAWTVSLIEQVF